MTVTQNVIFIAQENVAETAEVASPPQPEVTDAQPVNADAENPPSGDAVTEESPSQPVDEVSPEGGVAEAGVVAEGDGTGQIQGEGEGGEGEKPVVEDEAKQAQEGQDNFEVSCFCCPSFPVFSKGQSNAGFEPGRAIAPIPHCNWNCPFKKRPRGQFVPFKI